MHAAIPTADQRGVSYRPRLRASRAGGRDASREQSSSDETQERGDSGAINNTTNDKGTSPPGDKVQQSETQRCTRCVVIAVKKCWAASGYYTLKTLECQCNDGVLVIRGSVPTFYFKQMAQESIRSVEGVERIVNELSVQEPNATVDTRRKDSHDRAE